MLLRVRPHLFDTVCLFMSICWCVGEHVCLRMCTHTVSSQRVSLCIYDVRRRQHVCVCVCVSKGRCWFPQLRSNSAVTQSSCECCSSSALLSLWSVCVRARTYAHVCVRQGDISPRRPHRISLRCQCQKLDSSSHTHTHTHPGHLTPYIQSSESLWDNGDMCTHCVCVWSDAHPSNNQ